MSHTRSRGACYTITVLVYLPQCHIHGVEEHATPSLSLYTSCPSKVTYTEQRSMLHHHCPCIPPTHPRSHIRNRGACYTITVLVYLLPIQGHIHGVEEHAIPLLSLYTSCLSKVTYTEQRSMLHHHCPCIPPTHPRSHIRNRGACYTITVLVYLLPIQGHIHGVEEHATPSLSLYTSFPSKVTYTEQRSMLHHHCPCIPPTHPRSHTRSRGACYTITVLVYLLPIQGHIYGTEEHATPSLSLYTSYPSKVTYTEQRSMLHHHCPCIPPAHPRSHIRNRGACYTITVLVYPLPIQGHIYGTEEHATPSLSLYTSYPSKVTYTEQRSMLHHHCPCIPPTHPRSHIRNRGACYTITVLVYLLPIQGHIYGVEEHATPSLSLYTSYPSKVTYTEQRSMLHHHCPCIPPTHPRSHIRNRGACYTITVLVYLLPIQGHIYGTEEHATPSLSLYTSCTSKVTYTEQRSMLHHQSLYTSYPSKVTYTEQRSMLHHHCPCIPPTHPRSHIRNRGACYTITVLVYLLHIQGHIYGVEEHATPSLSLYTSYPSKVTYTEQRSMLHHHCPCIPPTHPRSHIRSRGACYTITVLVYLLPIQGHIYGTEEHATPSLSLYTSYPSKVTYTEQRSMLHHHCPCIPPTHPRSHIRNRGACYTITVLVYLLPIQGHIYGTEEHATPSLSLYTSYPSKVTYTE